MVNYAEMNSDTKDKSEDCIYDASAFADAFDKPSVTVPIVRATEEALASYGKIVTDYDSEQIIRATWPKTTGWRPIAAGTGNHQSAIEGDFKMRCDNDVTFEDNLAVGSAVSMGFATGLMDKSRNYVFVRDANYHPDGGQIFFPPAGGPPFVMLLASADVGDDVRPEHFRAFYFDNGVGFQIAPGVWHQAPYVCPSASCRNPEMTFKNKQSSVFACVVVDTVKEFGVYIKVPLQLNPC